MVNIRFAVIIYDNYKNLGELVDRGTKNRNFQKRRSLIVPIYRFHHLVLIIVEVFYDYLWTT